VDPGKAAGQEVRPRTVRLNGVVFRHAVAEDAEALTEFAARIYYETFAAVNTAENMQAYLASAFTMPQLQSELSDRQAIFILSEADGKLVGYAKLLAAEPPDCVTGEDPIELVRFYIDQSWHGSGLAAALMELCLSEARQRGFRTMYLGVWEKNLRAQAFYRKWKFSRVGEHVFYMGDDPQTDWWMTRAV
jgi:ribosomal protein S18 acetylase RimI-like enzyme